MLNFRQYLETNNKPVQTDDPSVAYRQATYWGHRIPELEPTILNDSAIAYRYAYNIIGNRWAEAEPIIQQDPEIAAQYAQD